MTKETEEFLEKVAEAFAEALEKTHDDGQGDDASSRKFCLNVAANLLLELNRLGLSVIQSNHDPLAAAEADAAKKIFTIITNWMNKKTNLGFSRGFHLMRPCEKFELSLYGSGHRLFEGQTVQDAMAQAAQVIAMEDQ